jgi:hypothetical protein
MMEGISGRIHQKIPVVNNPFCGIFSEGELTTGKRMGKPYADCN